jgi:hypothetical protein
MVENGRLKLGEKNCTMVVGTLVVSNLTQVNRKVHGAFSYNKLEVDCFPNVGESVNGQVNF